MKREWTVRAYKKGDEDKIFELVKSVYPDKKLTKDSWLKWWKWMFTKNPAGFARIWLADHNGKIVGQYPMVLSDMKVGKEIVKVSQNIDLMTHPDYRKQGMFLTLEKKALEEGAKEGINITIGFPNTAAYPGHLKTGWFDIGSLQIGIKPFNLKKMIGSGNQTPFIKKLYFVFGKMIIALFYREKKTIEFDNISITEIDSFNDRIDEFWTEVSNGYEITTLRNKNYLNWRYVNVPEVKYTIFIAEEKGKIQGYTVLRCVDEYNVKTGSIFDIFTPKDKPYITTALVSKSIEYFKNQRADLAFVLMFADKGFYKIFRNKGFIFSRFIQSGFIEFGQFCAYSSHPTIPKKSLMNKEDWFIQLGDSDSI
jgi:GNAT superfamily N-acetyltransferase